MLLLASLRKLTPKIYSLVTNSILLKATREIGVIRGLFTMSLHHLVKQENSRVSIVTLHHWVPTHDTRNSCRILSVKVPSKVTTKCPKTTSGHNLIWRGMSLPPRPSSRSICSTRLAVKRWVHITIHRRRVRNMSWTKNRLIWASSRRWTRSSSKFCRSTMTRPLRSLLEVLLPQGLLGKTFLANSRTGNEHSPHSSTTQSILVWTVYPPRVWTSPVVVVKMRTSPVKVKSTARLLSFSIWRVRVKTLLPNLLLTVLLLFRREINWRWPSCPVD